MKVSVFKGVIFISTAILVVTLLAILTVDYFQTHYENPGDTDGTPVRMVFVGDVMLSRSVGDIISIKGPAFPFEYVQDILKRGDITLGILEFPVSALNTTACEKNDRRLCFRASPDSLQGLTYAGFDIVTVANNHALDYKPEVMNDTLTRLAAAGIKYTGVQQSGEAYLPQADYPEYGNEHCFSGIQ